VVRDDPAWLIEIVRRLTDRHEARRPDGWSVDDAPLDYIESELRAIIGIELQISRLEGKRKLSQNRDPADVDGVIAGLVAGTPREQAVASEMRRAPRRG
jgi:transcriptional regulator